MGVDLVRVDLEGRHRLFLEFFGGQRTNALALWLKEKFLWSL